ncbi:MAG: hypothetical protein K0R72_212 [Clostridia bacterium]|jgi:hypothetical protein|nr:hypothetical protein [Clostridia bacterium]
MLTTNDIDALFHYSTESKDNDNDKREKNDRRILTICRKVPEVRNTIYDSKKGVMDSIQIVNERYSLILVQEEILRAVKEIRSFDKIISNTHIDISTKAAVIRNFDFKEYRKLLNICNFTGLKTICRLNNMKILADKYIQGELDRRYYVDDMKSQEVFYNDLLLKYESISVDNFYAYVLRYDIKTIKKKKPRGSIRR